MPSETTGYYDTEFGRITVAPEIVERFIVDEVRSSENFRLGTSRGEGGFFGRRGAGVRVEFNEGRVVASIPVHVRFKVKIRREARELQGKLVRAISACTGLTVERVAVDVYQVFDDNLNSVARLPDSSSTPPEAAALEPVEV